jgi:TM2 domain-containing membrane protein YozV
MEKVWVIEDPDEQLQRRRARRTTKVVTPSDEKSPARAYTLSLFFWGMGQNYNDQRGKGLLFQLLMLAFCTAAVLSLLFMGSLLQFLRSHEISAARVFILAEIVFFCALIFWTCNAGDAYHTAAKMRTTPFSGIQSRVYPFLCSLLVPGWGQFLNGQPIKGSIYSGFSVLGLFSLVSIPSVLLAWPSLEASETRFIVEEIFTLAVLFALLTPFIWIFGSYDALKVSLDDLKKEPFFDRIKYANNRRRTQGWVRGVIPHIKSTIILGLFLIVLLVVIYHTFPENFYREQLTYAQARLQERGMTIMPETIKRVLPLMTFAGK